MPEPGSTLDTDGLAMQRYVEMCEDALEIYGTNMIVLETGSGRYDNPDTGVTTPYKGWGGGTVTQEEYLLTAT
jgi:hypothetical protein